MRPGLLAALGALGGIGCTVSTDLPPDTVAPLVEISNPANNSTVGGGVPIDVSAADNYTVEVVRILIDGTLRATFYSRPYHMIWGTAGLGQNTVHIIVAEAVDRAQNIGRTQISVTVFNGPD